MSPPYPYWPYLSGSFLDVAEKRLRRLKCFSEEHYLKRNPDAPGHDGNGYRHAILHGAIEGRLLFERVSVARELGSCLVSRREAEGKALAQLSPSHDVQRRVSPIHDIDILLSSAGGILSKCIALRLASDLEREGIRTFIKDEREDVNLNASASIIVSPHEFFSYGRGRAWMRDDIVENVYIYNTVDIHTLQFSKAIPAILLCRGTIDLFPRTAAILRNAGLRAEHYEPSVDPNVRKLLDADWVHPLVKVLPSAARPEIECDWAWKDRPIDLSFFGAESPRRNTALAQYASMLAPYSTFIYLQHISQVIEIASDEDALARVLNYVSTRSKIGLHIHYDEFRNLDWYRMVYQGMASGTLVVTDNCLPHPDFEAGTHFLQDELRHIPSLIEWLLQDPDGWKAAERIVGNCSNLLFDPNDQTRRIKAIISFISSDASKVS